MRKPSRPNYNQNHQSILVNRNVFPCNSKIQSLNHFSKSHLLTRNSQTTRRVLNQSLLSKQSERVILSHLKGYLTSNNLLNPNQSAYTKHHSTETLLISLYNKLVMAIGHQQVSCLCLLAFGTIDHTILSHRLSSLFGISRTTLSWIKFTSPHALSLSMSLVTQLICKSSPRFCSRPPSVHSLHRPTQQTNFLILCRSSPLH